jgi:GTPase SAR1 family protein
MNLGEQILLKDFVNRDDELKEFCTVLDTKEHFIMIVCGTDGLGKTSLLTRLMYECGHQSRKLIKVADEGIGEYDYLMLMRQVVDAIGDKYFRPLNDLINFFTVPDYQPKITLRLEGSIEVANSAKFINSTVGDIVGIKDLHLPPRSDMRVPEHERMTRLSKQFFADLRVALEELRSELGNKPMVIFVDDVEKMTESTQTWIKATLLRSILNDSLKDVKFVLGITSVPESDRLMQAITKVATLKPFDEQRVIEYLNRRLKQLDQGLIDMVVANSEGLPLAIANMTDAYLKKYPERRAN